MWWKIIFMSIFVNVLAEFELQEIGETLSAEEATKQKYCANLYCVSDSELLFYSATQNASVDPCKDFKEFAMGTFIELRATNDRYREIGLISDNKHNHEERKRKLLAEEIDPEKDSRIVKVVKNFFTKCVNSRNVEINGLKDTISYLKSLGGSPFISGDSWDPSQFDIKNVFIKNPAAALYILLNYKFESYKFPLTDETPASYNGLKKMDLWGSAYDEDYYVDTKEMLEEVYNIYLLETVKKELVVSQISQAMDRVIAFRSEMVVHEDFTEEYNLTSNEALVELFDIIGVDFMKLLNSHKFNDKQLSKDDYVYVQGLEGLKWRLEALQKIDKGIVADAFALNYMYIHRFLLVVYPFYAKDRVGFNTRPPQRWEKCLELVETNMAPVLEFMLANTIRHGKEIDQLARSAMEDYLEAIYSLYEAKDVVDELRSTNFSIHLFEFKFTEQSLDDYYSELNLDGTESTVESAVEMEAFHAKIESDAQRNELEINASKDEIVYRPFSKISLKIPVVWTYYSWYHPDRPKFFNQATLFMDIVAALKFSINYYNEDFIELDDFDFAFKNYQKWLAGGGVELIIGGNRMTPSQLFWFSLARSRYYKGKYGATGYGKTDFYYSNNFRTLDSYDGFREVYHCK